MSELVNFKTTKLIGLNQREHTVKRKDEKIKAIQEWNNPNWQESLYSGTKPS
jgi:hypothetical protein